MDEVKLERMTDPQGTEILKVSGGVGICEAGEFREALLLALEAAPEVRVDVTGLTGIDLTGLQLLCSAHQSAVRRGKNLHIFDGGNATFRDTATGAGFQRHTGCPQDRACSCIWVGGES
ncbi:STAS domain-containing protein [Geomonas subterranea]|uniref:STAS domain-containing protein n=1 Tax=Geomonas subterranea TaxID=2847989 RepID=A0ABX8LHK6_9BACT|nr:MULTISPECIES: STAS domain-containing protein [Geomonas]QXE91518.1 STAS domain-containing protein [Geomonas subterranea]QXM10394.1 STAS domain-containing protein [Geomonas subterranea]